MSEVEKAAQALYDALEKEGDSHTACSEEDGFIKGAKWLLEKAKEIHGKKTFTNMHDHDNPRIFIGELVDLFKTKEEK